MPERRKFVDWVQDYPWLRKVVYAIARDKGVKEDRLPDTLQDAATAILEKQAEGKELHDPEAYGRKIAFNKVVDQLREAVFVRTRLGSVNDLDEDSEWVQSHQPAPSDYADVWNEINRLPGKSGDLVLRICGYGDTQREAATSAGLPPTTSFELFRKALKQIHQALAKAWLEGQVTRSNGEPLPRVTIELRRLPGAILDPQHSDGKGIFTFALRNTGKYQLQAKKKGYRPYGEQMMIPEGLTTRDIQLVATREHPTAPQPAGGV